MIRNAGGIGQSAETCPTWRPRLVDDIDVGYTLKTMKALVSSSIAEGLSQALNRENLSEKERDEVIVRAFEQFERDYGGSGDSATKRDLSETELRLIKEIESIQSDVSKSRSDIAKLYVEVGKLQVEAAKSRQDIAKLQVEVENLRGITENLRLEIEKLRSEPRVELKNLEVNLLGRMAQYQGSTIRWIAGFGISTILAVVGFALTR